MTKVLMVAAFTAVFATSGALAQTTGNGNGPQVRKDWITIERDRFRAQVKA